MIKFQLDIQISHCRTAAYSSAGCHRTLLPPPGGRPVDSLSWVITWNSLRLPPTQLKRPTFGTLETCTMIQRIVNFSITVYPSNFTSSTTHSYPPMKWYTGDQVAQANQAVENGQPVHAILQWGIPRTTLLHCLCSTQTHQVAARSQKRGSVSQKAHLAQWILCQANLGLPPTHSELRIVSQHQLQNTKEVSQSLGPQEHNEDNNAQKLTPWL